MSSSFYLFLSTLNSLTLTFSLSTFVFSSFFFLLYFWYICALLRLTFYIFLFLFCSLLYFYNLSSWVRCFIFLYNLCLLLPLSFFPLFYLSFSSLLYLLAAFNSIASFMLPSFPEPVINPGTESSSSHHTPTHPQLLILYTSTRPRFFVLVGDIYKRAVLPMTSPDHVGCRLRMTRWWNK